MREYKIRKGSGGRGKQQGGDGVIREIETLAPARMSLLADRSKRGPYGLSGGKEGKPGSAVIIRGGRARKIGSKGSWELEAGDRVRIETPGGGGYGRKGARVKGRGKGKETTGSTVFSLTLSPLIRSSVFDKFPACAQAAKARRR